MQEAPGQAIALVLYAANQKEGYFKLSEPGSMEVFGNGRTRFVPSANGRRRYLIADAAQKSRWDKFVCWRKFAQPSFVHHCRMRRSISFAPALMFGSALRAAILKCSRAPAESPVWNNTAPSS
jgi:hypothetical protein